jgi:hypothetical protein
LRGGATQWALSRLCKEGNETAQQPRSIAILAIAILAIAIIIAITTIIIIIGSQFDLI